MFPRWFIRTEGSLSTAQEDAYQKHIPLRLGRLEEVKETTEFSGITLSPGFYSSANWDAGNYANERMCKCEVFNIQYA